MKKSTYAKYQRTLCWECNSYFHSPVEPMPSLHFNYTSRADVLD